MPLQQAAGPADAPRMRATGVHRLAAPTAAATRGAAAACSQGLARRPMPLPTQAPKSPGPGTPARRRRSPAAGRAAVRVGWAARTGEVVRKREALEGRGAGRLKVLGGRGARRWEVLGGRGAGRLEFLGARGAGRLFQPSGRLSGSPEEVRSWKAGDATREGGGGTAKRNTLRTNSTYCVGTRTPPPPGPLSPWSVRSREQCASAGLQTG
eukprot:352670-Chlamydomonas_euryale.AAC.1